MNNSQFILICLAVLCTACTAQSKVPSRSIEQDARSPFEAQRQLDRGQRAYMTSKEDLYGKTYLRAENRLSKYPGVAGVKRGWPAFAGFEVYTDQPDALPEVLYGFRVRALPRRLLN